MSIICSELHRLLDGLHHYRFPFNEGSIPSNGIYFLFEEGETAHGTNRIVRVGTHRGQNRLASRLIEHFINENKDRSIFRKNIGRALLTKTDDPFLEKWESDLTTREARYLFESTVDMQYQQSIETQVTKVIRSTFSFATIPFFTYEDRHLFEKKAISTLSLCSECKSSNEWLGRYSPVFKIRESGLWNVQHLYKNPISDNEMKTFRGIICG